MDDIYPTAKRLLGRHATEDVLNDATLRLDLRHASSQLSIPVASAIIESWNKNKGHVDACVSYDTVDFLYTDNALGNNKIFPKPIGEYFDALSDVEFEITIVSSDRADIDACYLHSDDFSDEGLIEVQILVPTDRRQAKLFFPKLQMELRATLSHEMQHAVQRVIYGHSLDSIANANLETHMNDPMEIDARVEENIAYLEDTVREDNFDKFSDKLKFYIQKYLSRNASSASLEQIEIYKSRMMSTHIARYIEKIGISQERNNIVWEIDDKVQQPF
mgnify:CR=1 FL=1